MSFWWPLIKRAILDSFALKVILIGTLFQFAAQCLPMPANSSSLLPAVFFMLVLLQLKHFVADYPLQTPYMLQKFDPSFKKAFLPLLAHAGVHGYLTLKIYMGLLVTGYAKVLMGSTETQRTFYIVCGLALLDMFVHFIMDRIKASPNMLGRYKSLTASEIQKFKEKATTPIEYKIGETYSIDVTDAVYSQRKLKENTLFWHSLGLDQMVHHLTDIAILCAFIYLVLLK